MKYILIFIVIIALFIAVFSMEKIKTQYEYTEIKNLNPQVDSIDTTDTIANDWCETHKCKE